MRTPHAPGLREARAWSAVYVGVAVVFGLLVLLVGGGRAGGGEYFAGYLTEKSLSVDNLFVFVLIMASFARPAGAAAEGAAVRHRRRAGAARRCSSLVGAAAIESFSWVFYVFGAFLVWTAVAQARSGGHAATRSTGRTRVLRLVRRVVPTTDELRRRPAARPGSAAAGSLTPLAIALLAIGSADVLFAVDSIPAIFGLTQDTFLVFAANAFSLLGLRQLFFLSTACSTGWSTWPTGWRSSSASSGPSSSSTRCTPTSCRSSTAAGRSRLVPEVPTWLSLAVIAGTLGR